ncbi:MAG TPA: hypothetical protein VJN18_15160 [Polyangiaceae bacterium]|nr:hypothetical protein [Polyangiaceae bacterium]
MTMALGLALPAVARAQDTTRADETFQAGRALLKDGKYADACPKFEESQRHDPASGTLLALAYCQELSGLLASSWANYLAAADLAAREGQTERHTAATDRAKGLSERYSTLTIVVPAELGNLPGLRVLRDGIEVERSAYNGRIPLNGGMHSIEAVAPGRERWSGAITLQQEADHKTMTLPVLGAERGAGIVTFNGPPKQDSAPPAMRPVPANRMRQASLLLAVGSGVALGLGATFGILATSRNKSSNEDGHCDPTGCDAIGIERRNAALSAASVSTWSFIAAGALATSSIVLFLNSSPSKQSTRIETGIYEGTARVAVTRKF